MKGKAGVGGAKAPQPINAKAETVVTSRYFATAFKRHRCLIPADGWYEWLSVDGRKQPHYLTRADEKTLYLAGIWTERGADLAPGVASYARRLRRHRI